MFEVQGHEYRAGPAINQEIGSKRCDASFPRCPSTMLFSFWKVTLPKAIIGLLLNTQKQKGRKSMSSNRHRLSDFPIKLLAQTAYTHTREENKPFTSVLQAGYSRPKFFIMQTMYTAKYTKNGAKAFIFKHTPLQK